MESLKKISVLASILLVASSKETNRIIDGLKAREGQFPHLVSIQESGNHICGGAILNEFWILTAAHCVYRKPINNLKVFAGITNLQDRGQEFEISSLIVDKDIDDMVWIPDVALVKLSKAIQFNARVKTIELQTNEVPDVANLTVAGWGETEHGYPRDLMYLNVERIPTNDCKEAHYPLPVYDFNICTSTYTFQGICFGDSGSPVLYENRVAGIVNWIAPCAVGAPDVHSKVSAFLPWIREQMLKN